MCEGGRGQACAEDLLGPRRAELERLALPSRVFALMPLRHGDPPPERLQRVLDEIEAMDAAQAPALPPRPVPALM